MFKIVLVYLYIYIYILGKQHMKIHSLRPMATPRLHQLSMLSRDLLVPKENHSQRTVIRYNQKLFVSSLLC